MFSISKLSYTCWHDKITQQTEHGSYTGQCTHVLSVQLCTTVQCHRMYYRLHSQFRSVVLPPWPRYGRTDCATVIILSEQTHALDLFVLISWDRDRVSMWMLIISLYYHHYTITTKPLNFLPAPATLNWPLGQFKHRWTG